jgi:hypothetical protein
LHCNVVLRDRRRAVPPLSAGIFNGQSIGSLQANGYELAGGDALMFSDEASARLLAVREAEAPLFDMA